MSYPARQAPATRYGALDAIALQVVAAGVAPAACCAAARRTPAGWELGVGAAGTIWPAGSMAVGPETPFDLASLTKPLVALAAAHLLTHHQKAISSGLVALFHELQAPELDGIDLKALLSHRAGFVPHLPLYAPLTERRSFRRMIALRQLVQGRLPNWHPGGQISTYSDLGYILAGVCLERVFDRQLRQLVRHWVTGPLGLDIGSVADWLEWNVDFARRVAPTEVIPWRGGLLKGVVHDENAWAMAGHGLCGHAGAFGTAADVARFAMAVCDAQAGLSGPLDRKATQWTLSTPGRGTARVGFDSKSGGCSAAGRLAGVDTFGHLGFTGTSVWCDPEPAFVTVLLTNRVCPTRDPNRLRPLRPEIHDQLTSWLAK